MQGSDGAVAFAQAGFECRDLGNAGGTVVDAEVVIDGNLITSRSPADLPAFCSTILEQFAHAPTGAAG